MSTDRMNFLKLLFEPGEYSCFTDSMQGYRVSQVPKSQDVLFCINALHSSRDKEPSQNWHSSLSPRRADCNVVSYRNFLIEMDSMPHEFQRGYINGLRVPYSTIVHSGGKSQHFIISLTEPLSTLEEYKNLASRLTKYVSKADPSTKNPSRLSRLPGAVRPETGVMQSLLYLGDRIPLTMLLAALPKEELRTYRPKTPEQTKSLVTPMILEAALDPQETMKRFNIQSRNQFFYWLFCRFKEIGLPKDKQEEYVVTAYANLKDTSDFTFKEACQAARILRS